jgi:hypothetical protein
MAPSAAALSSFDMAMSIPAKDLFACVDHAREELHSFYPQALLPDAQWILNSRSEELGLEPKGQVSANASCRLMACEDGWLAVNLARQSDLELMSPWLATELEHPNWQSIQTVLAKRGGQELLFRGREMGLPLAFVAKPGSQSKTVCNKPQMIQLDDRAGQPRNLSGAQVVDLSALWAGPLCAHLLHACGAQVTSVSSLHRPDGAAQGSPRHYQQLHRGHEHWVVDFHDAEQRGRLAAALAQADVVIEASRPRALQGLGLDRQSLQVTKPQLWLSITAYGRADPQGQWVGFGDDVAASAGLLDWQDGRPSFVGDAIADPLTGTFAALAVAEGLARGYSGLLDMPMVAIADQCRNKIEASGRPIQCPLSSVPHAH